MRCAIPLLNNYNNKTELIHIANGRSGNGCVRIDCIVNVLHNWIFMMISTVAKVIHNGMHGWQQARQNEHTGFLRGSVALPQMQQ